MNFTAPAVKSQRYDPLTDAHLAHFFTKPSMQRTLRRQMKAAAAASARNSAWANMCRHLHSDWGAEPQIAELHNTLLERRRRVLQGARPLDYVAPEEFTIPTPTPLPSRAQSRATSAFPHPPRAASSAAAGTDPSVPGSALLTPHTMVSSAHQPPVGSSTHFRPALACRRPQSANAAARDARNHHQSGLHVDLSAATHSRPSSRADGHFHQGCVDNKSEKKLKLPQRPQSARPYRASGRVPTPLPFSQKSVACGPNTLMDFEDLLNQPAIGIGAGDIYSSLMSPVDDPKPAAAAGSSSVGAGNVSLEASFDIASARTANSKRLARQQPAVIPSGRQFRAARTIQAWFIGCMVRRTISRTKQAVTKVQKRLRIFLRKTQFRRALLRLQRIGRGFIVRDDFGHGAYRRRIESLEAADRNQLLLGMLGQHSDLVVYCRRHTAVIYNEPHRRRAVVAAEQRCALLLLSYKSLVDFRHLLLVVLQQHRDLLQELTERTLAVSSLVKHRRALEDQDAFFRAEVELDWRTSVGMAIRLQMEREKCAAEEAEGRRWLTSVVESRGLDLVAVMEANQRLMICAESCAEHEVLERVLVEHQMQLSALQLRQIRTRIAFLVDESRKAALLKVLISRDMENILWSVPPEISTRYEQCIRDVQGTEEERTSQEEPAAAVAVEVNQPQKQLALKPSTQQQQFFQHVKRPQKEQSKDQEEEQHPLETRNAYLKQATHE